MPKKEKTNNNPVELFCRPDPKNKKRLVCKETEAKQTNLAVPQTEIEPISEDTAVTNGRPNIVIGAINIGTEPVKAYLKNRWQRFYQESQPKRHFHFIIDLLLAAAVLGLLIFNVMAFRQGQQAKQAATPVAEFKMTLMPTKIALGQKTQLDIDYFNSGDKPLDQAKFVFKVLRGLQVISVQGGAWDAVSSFIQIGDVLPISTGKVAVMLQSVALGKGEIFVDFASEDKNGRLVNQQSQGAFLDVVTPELKVLGQARYFSPEGEQLGRGSLPPKVGKTTKYQIYLSIQRPVVDMEGVKVQAKLPQNVEWDNFVPLNKEAISYDIMSGILTWNIGKVYASVDLSPIMPVASFRVSLTPDAWQQGQEAVLLEQIKVNGKGILNGVLFKGESPDLTTNLTGDVQAQGKGVVE
ncbi:MAG: hypothetical protein Q8M83_04465 [bacterium]|nr:hypothetical protein [bacterium]